MVVGADTDSDANARGLIVIHRITSRAINPLILHNTTTTSSCETRLWRPLQTLLFSEILIRFYKGIVRRCHSACREALLRGV